MPTDVIMPALGVAQQTGTLLKWLKAEGQPVTKGEPLMEVETDKATVEIEAPGSGILTQVTAKSGEQVPVGQTIACILAPGESLPPDVLVGVPPSAGEAIKSQPEAPKTSSPRAATAPAGRHLLASPAARRIAKERGVEIALVKGTGPEGSVLAKDVLHTVAEARRQSSTAASGQIVPLTPMRRLIGDRMAWSKQTAPHFYLSMDIDMHAVIRLRAEWPKDDKDREPSFNDFVLHACARALRSFPALNSSFVEGGIRRHSDIHVGIAVALEEGLVVPVVRHADRLHLRVLADLTRELISKAQEKKLLPLDYEGGTFTITNLGMLGVDSFTAIINPPQCAILAIGRIVERVVADNGMFAITPTMTATLSADHRVIDGAAGARFLQEVKFRLEKGTFDL